MRIHGLHFTYSIAMGELHFAARKPVQLDEFLS
jgi:hypothetical protein